MMNTTYSDWWCNYENYWTNGERVNIRKEVLEYEDKKGRKVVLITEDIQLGKYPSLARMQFSYKEKKYESSKVKQIAFDADINLFLFEDYMVMGERLDGSVYYYVDFSGMPVTDAWTNLTDTIYSRDMFWNFDEEDLIYTWGKCNPWNYSYKMRRIQEEIALELNDRSVFQRKRVLESLEKGKIKK